jgi:hypothetical protein
VGERDRGLTPPPAAPPRLQRSILAALLLALLAAVLALGPAAPAPVAGTPALVSRGLESVAGLAAVRGVPVLGVVMLAGAAALACRALERRIGAEAPLLVALLIFGSGCWALVWTAGSGLVPLALAVAAFGLAYGGGGVWEEPPDLYPRQKAGWGDAGRWLLVGLLLAELVPTGPLLGGLLLPAALAVPRARRYVLLPILLGGFVLGLAAELALHGPGLLAGPAGLAAESIRIDPLLAGRSLVYLLVGRNVGLLCGFAPLLLLLALGRGSGARPALAGVCLALPALAALLLPFDFAAGWLNVSFLPIYGALWHLPARPPRRWEWLATVLVCGLATWPVWVSPRAALAEQGVGLTAASPRRHLPYETTLRSLPNRGEARLPDGGGRVRAVAGCRLLADPGRFELDGAGPAELWLATPSEVGMVALELGPGAPSSLEVDGATAGRTVFRPDGRVGFEVLLSEPRGRHRLWFGEGPSTLHLMEIRLAATSSAAPLRFRLLVAPQP